MNYTIDILIVKNCKEKMSFSQFYQMMMSEILMIMMSRREKEKKNALNYDEERSFFLYPSASNIDSV